MKINNRCCMCDIEINNKRNVKCEDSRYRCSNCLRKKNNKVEVKKVINITCNDCGVKIVGKRLVKTSIGTYRCIECQKTSRNMKYVLKRVRVSEEIRIELKRVRNLIASIKYRLKKFGFDLTQFQRPFTRELAKVLTGLPEFCVDCGVTENLTVDHIIALASGGDPFAADNLTTRCRSCNSSKGAR